MDFTLIGFRSSTDRDCPGVGKAKSFNDKNSDPCGEYNPTSRSFYSTQALPGYEPTTNCQFSVVGHCWTLLSLSLATSSSLFRSSASTYVTLGLPTMPLALLLRLLQVSTGSFVVVPNRSPHRPSHTPKSSYAVFRECFSHFNCRRTHTHIHYIYQQRVSHKSHSNCGSGLRHEWSTQKRRVHRFDGPTNRESKNAHERLNIA